MVSIAKSFHSARQHVGEFLLGAPQGVRYEFSAQLDGVLDDLVKDVTPKKVRAILDRAADGRIEDALLLFEQMEETDERLGSVTETRRMELTHLDWDIVSAWDKDPGSVNEGEAEMTANWARRALQRLKLDEALEHLAHAVGTNLAALELVWEGSRLVDLAPVPTWRLTMDTQESLDVRLITEDDRLGELPRPTKLVVHVPVSSQKPPVCKARFRKMINVWLIKRIALGDWATFVELFGMPMRIGKYDAANARESMKKAFRAMLAKMGSRGWAMISKSTEIELIESSQRGTSPHQAMIEYCDRAMTIAMLGGNLGTDTTGGTGTFAAAEVQDDQQNIRRDGDIRAEGCMVRDQILRPMVRYRFGPGAPVPYFDRKKPEARDRIKEGAAIKAAQAVGIAVGEDYARERMEIPKPEKGGEGKEAEGILEPLDAFEAGITEGGFSETA